VRPVWLLLRKDLTILRRSPLLLGALVAYPIVIALLVGLVAGYASAKPRVAFVDEDGIPPVVAVGGHRFHIQTVIDQVANQVTLVRMSSEEADRELASGKIVASITVPPGFLSELVTTVQSPELVLRTVSGGLAPRVTQQMQALVYQLNRKLQAGFIDANLRYVNLILHGGNASFLGKHFDVLGLDKMESELNALPPSARVERIRRFTQIARLALAQTGNALQATANPIELAQPKSNGRSWALSAQVQSYGIALTVTFLALLLAAGSAAAEHDEGTIGRLRRGLVSFGQLVWSKVALATVVGVGVGAALALVFGLVVEVGGVRGGEPWARLPLLFVAIALAAGVAGALGTVIGALAREARTASLLAVLVALPIVLIGLVPRGALPAAWWISELLPFLPSARLFSAVLYDASPWSGIWREVLLLLALGTAFWLVARAAVRRLAA
jgi:ABC-2 type transport system permease protein